MKMRVEQTMRPFVVQVYDSHNDNMYYTDVSFGVKKINFTYTPTELCLLFRYTYSTKKYFLSVNAGVSTVLINDTRGTAIPKRNDNTSYTSNGTTYETVYSTTTVEHSLVPNNSINNILGIRCGYNGKRITPYITLQRHGANSYSFVKFGVGALLLL